MQALQLFVMYQLFFNAEFYYGGPQYFEDAAFWHNVGMNHLHKTIEGQIAVKDKSYKAKAKNIIVFLGDGMGITTITAGRIFKGQQPDNGLSEAATLAMDLFPHTGFAKTYSVNMQVSDSASTATALFCGSKTNTFVIGMDMTCSPSDPHVGQLTSIMKWAQDVGKRTGIVTTARVTHATPAATYARTCNRKWECDGVTPDGYADIATQLVHSSPGKNLNVIMGGGLSTMGYLDENEYEKYHFVGSMQRVCQRTDGRNLVLEWLDSAQNGESRAFVQKRSDLQTVDKRRIDKLMGIFRNNHMSFNAVRDLEEPTLTEMLEAAIEVLDRRSGSNGFVLLVEGGRIDMAHHQNHARMAMHEFLEFDRAVEAALSLTNPQETLIIVTADHSHTMTINGYPPRGNDILGLTIGYKVPIVYETLSYANGPAYMDHIDTDNEIQEPFDSVWKPLDQLTNEERESPTYRHMATIPLTDETHGGEDVAVYAYGPGSNLIRGVFEQNYVAYVMSYVGCMGPVWMQEFDDSCRHSASYSDKKRRKLNFKRI